MSAAIVIESISFSYPDGTAALKGVSLTVRTEESVGIVGPNGAGKSTLVNHLNGYFLPQCGKLSVNGTPLTKKNLDRIRREVGVVFQNPDDQLFMSRVYDDVAFGPSNLGLKEEDVERDVETTLTAFDLWHLRERPPFHLSQGQKRFAAFAAVLVMRPSVVVMDEPTSDLDPRNRRNLIRFVNELQATRIAVSHDLDFIWDTCERVVIMCDGRIVTEGPTKEILSSQSILQANGLELPLRLQR